MLGQHYLAMIGNAQTIPFLFNGNVRSKSVQLLRLCVVNFDTKQFETVNSYSIELVNYHVLVPHVLHLQQQRMNRQAVESQRSFRLSRKRFQAMVSSVIVAMSRRRNPKETLKSWKTCCYFGAYIYHLPNTDSITNRLS